MATVSSVRFQAAPGKMQEAVAHLGKVAVHLKSITGNDYRVFTQLAGPVGHIMIASTWESVAAWDAARKKTTADAAWQKMVKDAAGLWIAGSIESAL